MRDDISDKEDFASSTKAAEPLHAASIKVQAHSANDVRYDTGRSIPAVHDKHAANDPQKAADSLRLAQHNTMAAIALVAYKGEPRVDSRLLAVGLRNQHKAVMALIDRYLEKVKLFGQVPFQKEVGDRSQGGGNPRRYALLNEDQCAFLLSLSRNSDHVVNLKANLVMAFKQARAGQELTATEYLPGYRQLHDRADQLAANSASARHFHMNLNKLVNKTVGISAGQRGEATATKRAQLVVANTLATDAMKDSNDHREGYQAAKKALDGLGQLLIGAGTSKSSSCRPSHSHDQGVGADG